MAVGLVSLADSLKILSAGQRLLLHSVLSHDLSLAHEVWEPLVLLETLEVDHCRDDHQ